LQGLGRDLEGLEVLGLGKMDLGSLEARIRARIRRILRDFATEDFTIEEAAQAAMTWIRDSLATSAGSG